MGFPSSDRLFALPFLSESGYNANNKTRFQHCNIYATLISDTKLCLGVCKYGASKTDITKLSRRSDIYILYIKHSLVNTSRINSKSVIFYWQCIFVNNVILFYKRKTLIPQVTACVS